MNCPVCNKEYKENEVFCKNCGTPFTVRQHAFNTYKPSKTIKPLKTGAFLGLLILSLIPLVNLIVFFILAFVRGINLNIRNFSRAVLFLILIITVVVSVSVGSLYYFNIIKF